MGITARDSLLEGRRCRSRRVLCIVAILAGLGGWMAMLI